MAKAFRPGLCKLGALASALAIVLAGASGPAAAQGVRQRPSTPGGVMRPATPQPTISQPVVQPLPGRDSRALDAALGRLARDPRDIDALIEAGNAALVMGDVDAATGFFRRADQVSPGNPRVKAGLAGAMVHNGDPFGAIPLFDEAEKAGALDGSLAADRGLAYDLVGDYRTAQRLYRQALTRSPSDEVTRRLALSLAIGGDKQGAEMVLSPLLQQRNLSAWRTRTFVLAILGQTEEAVSIANTILPSELATGVAPYLRYMPRLTRAQQAAAANFGAFPRASEIGRDDPRVAQYAPKRGSSAAVDAALTPRGEPLGRNARGRDRRSSRGQSAALVPPEPQPARAREVVPPAAPVRTAAPVAAAPRPAPPLQPGFVSQSQVASVPSSPPSAPGPAVAPRPATGTQAIAPGFSLTPAPSSASAPAAAVPPPAPAPAPPASAPPPLASAPAPAEPAVPRSLAEAFAEFDRPSTDATPAAGAVDLRRLKPARPKSAEPAKPPVPIHPSRIWVQVATGRDKAALGHDWRRMIRDKAEVFRGKQAFVSAWGQTNRLLTGPFQSETAANSYIAQLRRADVDGAFVWTSPMGQVVDTLSATAPRR